MKGNSLIMTLEETTKYLKIGKSTLYKGAYRGMHIRNTSHIPQNWDEIRSTSDIPELGDILLGGYVNRGGKYE